MPLQIEHELQKKESREGQYNQAIFAERRQNDGNGPGGWILLIPTTTELMNRFLQKEISEKELYKLTPLNATYEALYLCSALVLEEYRRQGIAKQLALNAIEKIRNDHPLKSLFVWAFTEEGDQAADALARLVSLPLFKRVG